MKSQKKKLLCETKESSASESLLSFIKMLIIQPVPAPNNMQRDFMLSNRLDHTLQPDSDLISTSILLYFNTQHDGNKKQQLFACC